MQPILRFAAEYLSTYVVLWIIIAVLSGALIATVLIKANKKEKQK